MCQYFGAHSKGIIFSAPKMKSPHAIEGKGALGCQDRLDGSAARSATGTATAAAAQRIGGGDGKTGTITGLNEIDFHGTAFFQKRILDQKFQAAFLEYLVAIF